MFFIAKIGARCLRWMEEVLQGLLVTKHCSGVCISMTVPRRMDWTCLWPIKWSLRTLKLNLPIFLCIRQTIISRRGWLKYTSMALGHLLLKQCSPHVWKSGSSHNSQFRNPEKDMMSLKLKRTLYHYDVASMWLTACPIYKIIVTNILAFYRPTWPATLFKIPLVYAVPLCSMRFKSIYWHLPVGWWQCFADLL